MYYERIIIGDIHFGFNHFTGKVVQFDSEEEADFICNHAINIESSYREILIQEMKQPTCLTITVELNNICNLKCVYCYQTKKGVRPEITIENIEKLMQYICSVYDVNHFQVLALRFIGGEPLLSSEKLYYCYNRIKRFCSSKNVLLLTHIDTNGTIQFADLVRKISNLDMVVCLSNKEDHDLKRDGSFESILRNIAELSNEEAKHVSICYNVDHTNVNKFEVFLHFVSSLYPQIKYVLTARIDDTSCRSNYVNKMSESEFAKWNSTVAIDLLIKYGYPILHSTFSAINRCQGQSRYSCKVYSDGAITVCDAMLHDSSRLTIDELIHDINLLDDRYKTIKKASPLEDPECSVCPSLIQCGGKVFCRGDNCNYQAEFNERAFIETYIKQTLMGNAEYFVNM